MKACKYTLTSAIFLAALVTANSAYSASLSTGASLGIPGFNGISAGEFSGAGPVTSSRYEHDGTLESAAFNGLPAGTYFADVDGHTDLGAGTLESNGLLSSIADAPSLSGLDGGIIFGSSSFSDVLTFMSTSNDDYTVTVIMDVSGNLDLNGADVFTDAGISLGDESDDGQYSNNGIINDTLTASVTLNGTMQLDIDAYIGYSADFYAGNAAITDIDLAAVIRLILPEGASFTSQSEEFLSSPVPVPAALPLFAFAIGALGRFSRKRTA